MGETPKRRAVRLLGSHVEAHYASGMGVHGSGKVVGYYDEPTFIIESSSGERFAWLASRVREAPEPQESAPTTPDAPEADSSAVLQADLAEILRALGLGDHARPLSPHEVVQQEVLPALHRLTATEADSGLDGLLRAATEDRDRAQADATQLRDAYRMAFDRAADADAENEALRLELGDRINDQADKVARLERAEAEIARLRGTLEAANDAVAEAAVARAEAAEDALRTLRERVAAVEALVDSWEHGADTWGTCSHEWVSLRKLRAALADAPAEATPPAEQRAEP